LKTSKRDERFGGSNPSLSTNPMCFPELGRDF
jgi:hypothetical protein